MPLTVLPEQESGQHLISEQLIVSPYTPTWWIAQVITGIPQESVGWLVAQGWQITAVTLDTDFKPPTPYYTMARQSLQNWIILQSLLDSYVQQFNTATTHNAIRYNDIVQSWDSMLDTSQAYFVDQGAERDAQALLFLGNLDTYMTSIEQLIDLNGQTLEADAADAKTAMTAQNSTVGDLEGDFTTHDLISQQFLEGLGTTELARINELFNATLSEQLQQLLDRGFYSSTIPADIRARNTRDRDEQIQLLNDRLNREQLENDHKLYEQKMAMRNHVIGGKERYAALTMQRASTLTEQRHRAIIEKMNSAAARLSGLSSQQTQNMELMKYWLDERNKLLIGIYSVVERREDKYPEFDNLVNLCVGLGDSAGGWVSP